VSYFISSDLKVNYLSSFCGAGITGTSNSGIRVVGSGVEETGVKGTGYCLVTVNGVGSQTGVYGSSTTGLGVDFRGVLAPLRLQILTTGEEKRLTIVCYL
jgi:hypothetical protein